MAKVVYSARALSQLERALEVLVADKTDAAVVAAGGIRPAVGSLTAHPLLGRRMHGDIRELAIPHQREIGFVP